MWTSANLIAWRQRMGWSQVVAAVALETPLNTYTGWEQGRRHADGLPGIISIACRLLEERSMTPQELASVMLKELKRQSLYVQDEGDDYGPDYVLVDGGVNLLKLAEAVLVAFEKE